jgi:transposase
VFKAPGLYGELRAAVRAHQVLVSDVVRAKNRLKAVFRSRGFQDMGTEVYEPLTRDKWIRKLPAHRRKLATLLGSELDAVTELHEEATQWLHKEAARCAIIKLIATAPGIGTIRAAQIVAVVLSPQRFRTRQQFWSYCGLGLVTRSSSDWSRDKQGNFVRRETSQMRGLNYNRNPMLKAVFKGAAQQIERMPAHPLHADYTRMTAAGMKPTVARVTIARKIAASVLAMWKNKEEYDPAKRQPKPHAA